MTDTPASGVSPTAFVRPELRQLKAYYLDQTAPYRYKLDQNEVPWDLPRRLKRRIVDQLLASSWCTYPEFNADTLRQALGKVHDWPWEGVLVGAGSSELLSLVLDLVRSPSDEVLGTVPSFGLYSMLVQRSRVKPVFLGPTPDLTLPFEGLMEEVERDPTRPLILCTPNNPTGDALTVAQVEALLERQQAPLLLDNAYHEFCRHDYRPLLDRYRHLVLLRTFSKAWAVAGLRIGYLLGDPELVHEIVKIKLPYNLGHPAVLTGLAVLEEPALSERAVRVVLRRRDQWLDLLRGYDLEVFPSETNFLMVRCGLGDEGQRRSAAVRYGLGQHGVLVRDVSAYPGLAGCFRLTIGGGGALRATRRALDAMPEIRRLTTSGATS